MQKRSVLALVSDIDGTLRNIIIEMMNLQTNIHDGEYEVCDILECVNDWELRIRAALDWPRRRDERRSEP